MQQAFGDGKQSAYCLVYVKESRLKETKFKHTFEMMGDDGKIVTPSFENSKTAANSKKNNKNPIVIDLLNLEGDSTKPPNGYQDSTTSPLLTSVRDLI